MSFYDKAHAVFMPGEGVGEVYAKIFNAGDHLHSCANVERRRRGSAIVISMDFLMLAITSL